jgi:hypothetical protein
MGYDAHVVCNCFKEGKTSDFPYKENIYYDGEDFYLTMEDLYKSNKEEYYKRYKKFDAWKSTACPHADFYFEKQYLANISGMAAFWTIIEELGGSQRFPILSAYLPTSNSGKLPTEIAEIALKELNDLEQEPASEKKAVLKIKNTGDVIQTTNENHPSIFLWTAYNKLQYGLDQEGFFIIENKNFLGFKQSKKAFKAKAFRQISDGNNLYRFIDQYTDKHYTGTTRIDSLYTEKEVDFVVEMENVLIKNEYNYIITPLKKLLNASIVTGNPVIWT